jgi:hypothetical protein
MPRPSKSPLKLAIVKVKDLPSTTVFQRSLLRASVYTEALLQLSATQDAALRIADNPGQIIQVKKAAEKLGFTLLFARVERDIVVKIVHRSDSQRRLLLLLREPRTINELRGSNLELDLDGELKDLSRDGAARLDNKGRWALTESGMTHINGQA